MIFFALWVAIAASDNRDHDEVLSKSDQIAAESFSTYQTFSATDSSYFGDNLRDMVASAFILLDKPEQAKKVMGLGQRPGSKKYQSFKLTQLEVGIFGDASGKFGLSIDDWDDVEIFTCVLSLCENGKTKEASALVDRFARTKNLSAPEVVDYLEMITETAKELGDPRLEDLCLKLWDASERLGKTEKDSSGTYQARRQLLAVAKDLKDKSLLLKAYDKLRPDFGIFLNGEYERDRDPELLFNGMVDAMFVLKKIDHAKIVADKLNKYTESNSKKKPVFGYYRDYVLARIAVKEGKSSEAMESIQNAMTFLDSFGMSSDEVRVASYDKYMDHLVNNRYKPFPYPLFLVAHEMGKGKAIIEKLGDISGKGHDSAVLALMGMKFAETGENDAFDQCVAITLQQATTHRTLNYRFKMKRSIVALYHKAGMTAKRDEFIDTLLDQDSVRRNEIYKGCLAADLITLGLLDKSYEVIQSIKSVKEKVYPLCALSLAIAKLKAKTTGAAKKNE